MDVVLFCQIRMAIFGLGYAGISKIVYVQKQENLITFTTDDGLLSNDF